MSAQVSSQPAPRLVLDLGGPGVLLPRRGADAGVSTATDGCASGRSCGDRTLATPPSGAQPAPAAQLPPSLGAVSSGPSPSMPVEQGAGRLRRARAGNRISEFVKAETQSLQALEREAAREAAAEEAAAQLRREGAEAARHHHLHRPGRSRPGGMHAGDEAAGLDEHGGSAGDWAMSFLDGGAAGSSSEESDGEGGRRQATDRMPGCAGCRYSKVPEAPTFYPTEKEFADPIAYITSIQARAAPFGICRIVPPTSWDPPNMLAGLAGGLAPTAAGNADPAAQHSSGGSGCPTAACSSATFRFRTCKQFTSHLCMRAPSSFDSSGAAAAAAATAADPPVAAAAGVDGLPMSGMGNGLAGSAAATAGPGVESSGSHPLGGSGSASMPLGPIVLHPPPLPAASCPPPPSLGSSPSHPLMPALDEDAALLGIVPGSPQQYTTRHTVPDEADRMLLHVGHPLLEPLVSDWEMEVAAQHTAAVRDAGEEEEEGEDGSDAAAGPTGGHGLSLVGGAGTRHGGRRRHQPTRGRGWRQRSLGYPHADDDHDERHHANSGDFGGGGALHLGGGDASDSELGSEIGSIVAGDFGVGLGSALDAHDWAPPPPPQPPPQPLSTSIPEQPVAAAAGPAQTLQAPGSDQSEGTQVVRPAGAAAAAAAATAAGTTAECVSSFGHAVTDEEHTLQSFAAYASWAKALHFRLFPWQRGALAPATAPGGGAAAVAKITTRSQAGSRAAAAAAAAAAAVPSRPSPNVHQVEAEFWRLVESPAPGRVVETLCGADLDSSRFGSGFPLPEWRSRPWRGATAAAAPPATPPSTSTREREYGAHPWNAHNLPRAPGGVLRYAKCPELARGLVVPTLHVSSCLSAFCWHAEEHALPSLCYLHDGAPRVWYGVPGHAALSFEVAMRDALPHLFAEDPQLLRRLVTILSPMELLARGVPVHRLVQDAGSFVVVFPGTYHAGLSTGYSVAESVNFAPPSWLPHGSDAVRRYRSLGRRPAYSHDLLLLTLVGAAPLVAARAGLAPRPTLPILDLGGAGDVAQAAGSPAGATAAAAAAACPMVPDWLHHWDDGVSLADAPLQAATLAAGELAVRLAEHRAALDAAVSAGVVREARMTEGDEPALGPDGAHACTAGEACVACGADLLLAAVVSPDRPGAAACPEHAGALGAPPDRCTLLYRHTVQELEAKLAAALALLPGAQAAVDAALARVALPQVALVRRLGPIVVLEGMDAAFLARCDAAMADITILDPFGAEGGLAAGLTLPPPPLPPAAPSATTSSHHHNHHDQEEQDCWVLGGGGGDAGVHQQLLIAPPPPPVTSAMTLMLDADQLAAQLGGSGGVSEDPDAADGAAAAQATAMAAIAGKRRRLPSARARQDGMLTEAELDAAMLEEEARDAAGAGGKGRAGLGGKGAIIIAPPPPSLHLPTLAPPPPELPAGGEAPGAGRPQRKRKPPPHMLCDEFVVMADVPIIIAPPPPPLGRGADAAAAAAATRAAKRHGAAPGLGPGPVLVAPQPAVRGPSTTRLHGHTGGIVGLTPPAGGGPLAGMPPPKLPAPCQRQQQAATPAADLSAAPSLHSVAAVAAALPPVSTSSITSSGPAPHQQPQPELQEAQPPLDAAAQGGANHGEESRADATAADAAVPHYDSADVFDFLA